MDTRAEALCLLGTIKGARCLSAKDFLGPHRRLANTSGLLWLLGSIGLTGEEHVLVAGDSSTDKEFFAGLLYVAGQKKITVLLPPITRLNQSENYKGRQRARTRESVYQAPMRAGEVVLQNDLHTLIESDNPISILDGRHESEYYGLEHRALRGGHIPGAQHFPMIYPDSTAQSKASVYESQNVQTIAYGYDTYEGLIYFSRLLANGIRAKIYLEGWSSWAANIYLNVDLVTYPASGTLDHRSAAMPLASNSKPQPVNLLALIIAALAFFGLGYYFRKISSK